MAALVCHIRGALRAADRSARVGQPPTGPHPAGACDRVRIRASSAGPGRLGLWSLWKRSPPHRQGFSTGLGRRFRRIVLGCCVRCDGLVSRAKIPRAVPRHFHLTFKCKTIHLLKLFDNSNRLRISLNSVTLFSVGSGGYRSAAAVSATANGKSFAIAIISPLGDAIRTRADCGSCLSEHMSEWAEKWNALLTSYYFR